MFQQNNLPFRFDGPDNPNPGYPNCNQFMNHVPIQNPAQLQELLNTCANEIYNSAQKNPIRMFMYNQCSANSWINNDFLKFVQFVASYAQHVMNSGMRTSLQEVVSYCAGLFASQNIAQYAPLRNLCDQGMLAEASGMVQQLGQISAQISNMSNPGMTGMINRNMGMNQPQRGMMGSGMNNPITSFFNNGGIQQTPQVGEAFNKWTTTTAPSQDGFFQSSTVSGPAATATAFDQSQKQEPTVASELSKEEGWSKWFPTLSVPYIPAVRFRDFTLTFRKESGLYIPVIRERSKMDYEAHLIPTTYGFIPREYGPAKIPDNSIDLIMKGANVIGGNVAEEVKKLVINPNISMDLSPEQVWFDMMSERICLSAEAGIERPIIYNTTAVIAEKPIIDKVNHAAWIKDIRNSRTLNELRVRIVSALDLIPKQLWRELDRRLTDKVQRVIKLQLGIPTLSFGSFTEDYEAVLEAIRNRGKDIEELFLKHQIEIIQAVVNVLDEEEAKTLTLVASDREKLPGVEVTYLSRVINLTYIDLSADELSIEIPREVGVAVTQEQSVEFHKLLSEILKQTSTPFGLCESHLIRTNDFFTFEIAKGYLGNDFNVIRLIDG